jgi:hypothetical protein
VPGTSRARSESTHGWWPWLLTLAVILLALFRHRLLRRATHDGLATEASECDRGVEMLRPEPMATHATTRENFSPVAWLGQRALGEAGRVCITGWNRRTGVVKMDRDGARPLPRCSSPSRGAQGRRRPRAWAPSLRDWAAAGVSRPRTLPFTRWRGRLRTFRDWRLVQSAAPPSPRRALANGSSPACVTLVP